MKYKISIVILIGFLLLQQVSGQEMFRLLNDKPVILDKGWKYKIGDNPSYALPKFNDRGWKPINANLDVHDSLPADAKTGIGWMRLKFFVGDKIRGQQLALKVHQSVASEIYLNGKFLASFGVIDSNPKKVKAYDPILKPIVFPLSSDSVQVLAVRFALQPDVSYTTIFERSNSLVKLESSDHESAVNFYRRINVLSHSFQYLMIGIWIMILVVHLSFYLWLKEQKANLYFSLYSVCYLFVGSLQLAYQINGTEVDNKFYYGNLGFFFILLSGLLINLTVYTFLNKKIDLYFKALVVLFFVAIIRNAYPYNIGWRTGGPLFQILVFMNLVRIGLISVKQGKRGAKLLTAGALATIILFGLFILQGTFNNASFFQNLNVLRISTYVVYTLCFPVVISFFLAEDFALTNKRLQQKLEEINELSKKNLAIEKEKQDILASQNQQLESQVKQRTSELSKSLEELKATQSQLIQSEKMASLGELTAGIAHEIQNPLNFVNNFSEVNMELSEEILEAVKNGELDTINQLAADIKSNQEKILEHGQRADGIVKSMLQHSRSNTGSKELTDINTLIDEYARLSYHGIKAKDKTFNVTFKADFDVNAGSCNIIPQDIGRVLLNLLNNALYAVQEKKAQLNGEYQPEVSVATKREKEALVITVADNGNGISETLREKIFQPFFTTKPTGSGTGLGLSLSYDIIKAHGGEFNVESVEGSSSKFIIQLPV